MRLYNPFVIALATGIIAAPTTAQENSVTLGVFVTVRAENVPDFEQGLREHNEWHGSQNDPQPWMTYQALTGHGEYAVLAPNMAWASLDAPAVDMGADVAHWSESGAEYTATEEIVLWSSIPGGNPPADPTQYPIVQVFEFEIESGGQPAVMDVIQGANEALTRTGAHFEWSIVVSADGPPVVFVALWAESFAQLGTPGPGPEQIMADAFGPGQGARLLSEFSEATTARSSQIWILRPDLSHVPGM